MTDIKGTAEMMFENMRSMGVGASASTSLLAACCTSAAPDGDTMRQLHRAFLDMVEAQDYFRLDFSKKKKAIDLPPEEMEFVVQITEKAESMEKDAYGYYRGDDGHEQDWFKARDLLTKLYEMSGDPFYANSLGYIYYYGRCNDHIPQYDEALKYFTIGYNGGVTESMYKYSDMLMKGYGIEKNEKAALDILLELYDSTKDEFSEGYVDNNFPDVALRLGGVYKNGLGDLVEADPKKAYGFYNEALSALNLRMEANPEYGDEKVLNNIKKAMNEILDGK